MALQVQCSLDERRDIAEDLGSVDLVEHFVGRPFVDRLLEGASGDALHGRDGDVVGDELVGVTVDPQCRQVSEVAAGSDGGDRVDECSDRLAQERAVVDEGVSSVGVTDIGIA